MKKKNIVFLTVLFIALIAIAGCVGKADRTFGPITLNIVSDHNPIIEGDTVILTAKLGFEDYSWKITSDNYGCTIEKISGDQALLRTTYQDTMETYAITIKVVDSQGNYSNKNIIVKKPNVTLTNSYLRYSSSSSITATVHNMDNFSKWVKVNGPAHFSDTYANPVDIYSDNTTTGKFIFYALDTNGHRSETKALIIYNTQSIYSNSSDGFITHVKSSGTNVASSNTTLAHVGTDTNLLTIQRAFFSFPIPSVITHIYIAHIYFTKESNVPTDLFSNDYWQIRFRYIGKDIIPSTGLTGDIYKSLNVSPDNPDNHYIKFYQKDGSYSYYIESTDPEYNKWSDHYEVEQMNLCIGHNFDVGLRFYDENFSEHKNASYYTSDNTGVKPYIYIYYY